MSEREPLPDDSPAVESADDDAPEASGLRDRASRFIGDAKKYLPWGSLAVGIGGALLMDRSPKGAWIVLVSAVLGWTAMWGFALIGRLDPADYKGRKRKLVSAARLASLVVTQSLIQNCLLFALPFYVQAATLSPLQLAFLATMVALVVISLWDPFYERVVRGRVAALGMMGFATFCGLNAVLPPLGLSNGASLVVSGLFAAIGVPLQTIALTPPAQRQRSKTIIGAALAIVVSLSLAFGGARCIPPAPMNLTAMAIGTELVDKQVEKPVAEVNGVPAVIYCATAIASPRGVKDDLFHVWRLDGVVKDEVKLHVSGGRKEGFRTWSKKTHLGRDPYGTWECSVRTKAGQLLGWETIEISRPSGAGD